MRTCPKCFKQNPVEAAFCGFCGGPMVVEQDQAAKKTMFGYFQDGAIVTPPAAKPAAAKAPPESKPAGPAAPSRPPLAPETESSPTVTPPPATDVSPPGERVGSYTLQAEHERLPVGVVHRATDGSTAVMLLVTDPGLLPSPLDAERARRELSQVQKTDCPELLRVLDHGKIDDRRMYVAYEDYAGEPLTTRLSRGALPLPEAQTLIRSIGAALTAAHKVGVIHRDIAPHNVLVAADGRAKVRGFGLAPMVDTGRSAGAPTVYGTPEYLSPEQVGGRPVDQRSNIYSLAALLCHMLAGNPPFSGDPRELLKQHADTEAPPAPEVGPHTARVRQLVSKALAKSSSRRHLTLRQFLRDVETVGDASAPRKAAPSFETPLHGVTSLTGGRRPPSSEVPTKPAPATGNGAAEHAARTMINMPAPSAPLPATAETIVPSVAAAAQASPVSSVAASAPPPPAEHSPVGLEPTIAPPDAPAALVTPDTGSAVGGEVSGGARVSLRQSPAAAEPPAPAEEQPKAGTPKAFRETMWFFKGEVESAMAEQGGEEAPPPDPDAQPNLSELADKYSDDGSMTDDEARRLSLRTGKTMMMQNVKIPAGNLPGKKMAAEDFIGEMNPGRKIAIWGGIALVVTLIGIGLYALLG